MQTCDWRMRPLSAEMIEYARKDTHYLIYLTKALIEKLHENIGEDHIDQFIQEIFRDCQTLCMKKNKKPLIFTDKYFKILSVLESNCSQIQTVIFEELWVKLLEIEKSQSSRIR